jgi:hypothetical protein
MKLGISNYAWEVPRAKRGICFPEFNLRLYDQNCESDYYFFHPPKSEYAFSATLGIRIFF